MALTVRKLRRLEAWSDWGAAGGARQAVIDDAISAQVSSTIENEQLIVTLPLDSPAAGSLGARKVIRVDESDASFDEYKIIDRATDDELSKLVITAAPFRITDLQGAGMISRKDSDGTVVYDFEVLGLTPTEIITNWVLPALAEAGFGWIAIGTITPGARLDMTFAWDTPLSVLLRLASATISELDVRKNGVLGYLVDIVTKVNGAAQQADLRVDKNLVNVTRSESSIEQVTRVFPKGSSEDGMAATMARATWRVAAVAGSVVTLEDPAGGTGPIQFDGQLDTKLAGILSYWPLESTAAPDVSGNGRNGTVAGGVTPTAGRVGKALNFDGTTGKITAGAITLGGASGMTVMGWVRRTNPLAQKSFFSNRGPGGAVYAGTNVLGKLFLFVGASGSPSVAVGAVTIPAATWVPVAITNDNVNTRFYINGVLDATVAQTLAANTGTIGIGWDPANATEFWDGDLDEQRVYSRPLSAQEIADIVALRSTPVGAYLRKVDGTLTAVTASSAAGETVTVASATGIAVGDLVQFRANAAGDDLVYLESPSAAAQYGVKAGVREVADVPATNNLVKNAAMRTWPGSSSAPPTNWTAVGAPTIAKQTAAPFTAIGGNSIKVTGTADGQGVISDAVPLFPTAANPYLSGFAKVWVASGNARVELVIATPSGTKVFPLLPDLATPTSLGQWFDVGAAGFDANAAAATSAQIRIVQNGAAASVFYVDAAQITQTPSQMPWFEGAGATRLWQEANESLRIGSSPVVSYTVPLVDLEAYDPVTWSESALIIGANARIVEPRLAIDIVTRIVGIERDYLNPQATSITLSNKFDDLTDLLSNVIRPERTGEETPAATIPQQPKLSASFDINGQLIINSTGDNDVVSQKIAYATGSAPSSATVRATTAINQQNISGLATGSIYAQGITVFISAYAYNTRGFESSPLTVISVSRQGAIIDYTPFASNLTPVKLVNALPGSGAFVGEIVFLTTDKKLYRWTGSAWTSAVETIDLTGQIQTAQIANLAVTAAQIGANAVIAGKIAADAVGAAEIAALAVGTAELAALAVTTAKIAALAVTTAELGALAVTTAKLATLSVDSSILAASAVIDTKIATDAVTTPKIIANAVTAAKIAVHTITANEITALTITAAEIATGTITAAKIAADTITAAEIQASAITSSELAANAVIAGKIAALTIVAGDIAANTITAAKIASHTITAAEITALTITAAEIAAGTITGAKLVANTITAGQIAALTITAAEIAALTITGAKIAAGTITADKIVANSITAGQIQAGAISATEIAAGAITSGKISAGTITATELAVGTITADRIVAGSLTLTQMSHVRGKWHRGANTSVPNNTDTKAIIDTSDIDPNSMYDAAGGGFKIPAGTATAFYLVRAYLKWDGTAGGTNANGSRQMYLMKNGSPIPETAVTGKPLIGFRSANGGLEQVTTWFGQLAANDPVCVGGFQDSGGALNFALVWLEVLGFVA